MSGTEPTTVKRALIQAAVLRATEDLLSDGATFADLKIEKIATAAGISRTAFYFYFRDKRELLMRLTEEITDVLYAEADRWFSASDADNLDELKSALAAIASLYREHGPMLRAIVEVSTYDEEIAGHWRQLLQRFADATATRITDEQAAGRSPGRSAPETAFCLVWMTERTFYQSIVQAENVEAANLVEAMAGIWERGIYG